MDFASEERLTVVDHPLIKHKLSVIRNEDTPDYLFRQTVREITLLEGYAATQDLATRSVEVKTPIAIRGIEPVVVPILRAGLGMLDGMLDLIPTAPVAHLGMYRDEVTHEPHEYYAKMPDYIAERSVLLVDPMLATGGSAILAIDSLKKRGVKDISACVIVASPEGVQTVLEHDPSVRLFTCAIDEGLNEDAYIVPGLGDAGDRIFRTEGTPVQSELA